MRTRSRNRKSVGGALLLGLIVAAPSLAATTMAAPAGSAKRDTVKATSSTTAPKPAPKPAATTNAKPTSTSKAVAVRKGPPPSRLATVAVKRPTRGTAMKDPAATRAAIAQAQVPKTKAAKIAPLAKAVPAPAPATTATDKPVAKRVPAGIPAAPSPKVAAAPAGKAPGKIVPATATGMAVVRPAPRAGATTPATDKGPAGARAGKVATDKITPARAPAVSKEKKAPVIAPLPFENQVAYQYNALGRRDPFGSLLEGEFVGMDVGGDAPPDLGGLKVVGIVWGSDDQFAMVEDVKGNSYVLRRGDKVQNGFVEGLKRDAIIVNITVDGQSQTVTIPITRKGEKNANR